MNRRAFVTGLGAVLAAPLALEAQQPGKVYRIGYLAHISDSSMPRLMEAFRESLASSGWIEGQNITIEYRSAEGNAERLPELARDLVRVGVDVIVALVPGAVLAATKATSAIPIVMVHGPDPVQLHLVGSLARPGGNITGLTTLSADLSAKQFELLKALVPSLTRIAVLSNPTNPWHPLALDGIEARARSIGVVVRNVPTRDVYQLDASFTAMVRGHADGEHVLADPMTVFARERIAKLALSHRLPAMGSTRETAEAGCLGSYWPNSADMNRRAAKYVDRILRGSPPGELPIEQPTKYDFLINVRTSRALGLTIPPSLLLRADQVIE